MLRVSTKRPAALSVASPSGQRTRRELEPLPFTIGRQADNHLVLRDSRASRHHGRIVEEAGGYVIEDLESRHGIYVNGERVQRQTLRNGDRISFGFQDSYELTFTLEEPELGRLLDQMPVAAPAQAGTTGLTKLRALLEVARAMQGSLSTQEVLETVVDAALAVTGAERGFLLLRDGENLDIRVARSRDGSSLPPSELKVPARLIHRALQQRRELLSMTFDAASEAAIRPDLSVADLELRSVVCVPLVRIQTATAVETLVTTVNETAGLLYLDSRIGVADLSSGNRELLQTLALEASTILENARLIERERARQRLEEELRIARVIQQDLLPAELPSAGWFRAAGSSIASHEVGGDYYDVRQMRPDEWSLLVADVSGKGVSSALLAALLQGAFMRSVSTEQEMCEVLASLNRYLLERTGGEKYATLFYGVVRRDGLLQWSNAAHCAPLLVRVSGELETLPPTSLPVGMLEGATYETRTTKLSPGDLLVVYSDGLTEARNKAGEFFEMKRLKEVARSHAAAGSRQLHDALLESLTAFSNDAPQADDITLVVVEYRPE